MTTKDMQQRMIEVVTECNDALLNGTPAIAVLVVTLCAASDDDDKLVVSEIGGLSWPKDMPDSVREMMLPKLEHAAAGLFNKARLQAMPAPTEVLQ